MHYRSFDDRVQTVHWDTSTLSRSTEQHPVITTISKRAQRCGSGSENPIPYSPRGPTPSYGIVKLWTQTTTWRGKRSRLMQNLRLSMRQGVPCLLKVIIYTVFAFCLPFFFFLNKSDLFIVLIHLAASRLDSRLKSLHRKMFWNITGPVRTWGGETQKTNTGWLNSVQSVRPQDWCCTIWHRLH